MPVGVLLSGGVDSAGIVALAAGEQADPVKTFSVGFEEASFDELERARLVAERYGTEHHEIVLRPDAVELLPKLVEAFDEPFGDSSALPTYLVSELAAGEVKVALSGEGGDELFGGYYTYVADLLAPRIGRLAALAAPLAEPLPSSDAKVSLDYKAKRFAQRRPAAAAGAPPRLEGDLLAAAPGRVAGRPGPRLGPRRPLPRALRGDRRGRAAGPPPGRRPRHLPGRRPAGQDRPLEHGALAGAARPLPRRRGRRRWRSAWRRRSRSAAWPRSGCCASALAPLLPKEVLRGPKQGFSIPVAAWLRGPLRGFAREVLSAETLSRQGWLDPATVTGLLDRHCSGREDLSRQLWGLIAFTLWFDRYAT